MNDELVGAVVYAARKLHWTRKEIGDLTPAQFSEIVEELYYQEAVERYELLKMFSLFLAVIHNAPIPKQHPKIKQPEDFIKLEEPMRREEALKKKAKENRPNIQMPKYKLAKMED